MKACDVRRDFHVPGNITRKYGADHSGTILYEFNSRGYRGEEYDPAAAFRICVIGDSHAFGLGIGLEHTFGYKLKQHMARSLQLDIASVNLINLSVGGTSADYCVRTLHRQLSHCDVDLVIFQLPPPDRIEYTDGKTFHPYSLAIDPKNIKNAPTHLVGYFEYYNKHVGRINMVKNALLAQAFLKERKTDYVLATHELIGMRSLGYLKDYLDRLDASALLLHRYLACKADLAADGWHAGPRCNAAFAVELLSFLGRMQLQRGNRDLGCRIDDYASHLRETDEDWKHCTELISNRAKEARRGNAGVNGKIPG